jgi:hypothetical protein
MTHRDFLRVMATTRRFYRKKAGKPRDPLRSLIVAFAGVYVFWDRSARFRGPDVFAPDTVGARNPVHAFGIPGLTFLW